jgi:hypothetical protein
VIGHRSPITDHRSPITDHRSPITDHGTLIMTPSPHDISETTPGRLADLMNLDMAQAAVGAWTPQELGAILGHQMQAAIVFDLGTLDPKVSPKLRTLATAQGLLMNSFADLFGHPQPPVELLRMVKDFAKANRRHPRSTIPVEVATVMYYTAIAAAFVRCGARVTRLPDDSLGQGFRWVTEQQWVQPICAELCRQGLEKLQKG